MSTSKRISLALLLVASLTSIASADDPVSSAIRRSRSLFYTRPVVSSTSSYTIAAPSYGVVSPYWRGYNWRRSGYVLNDRIRAYNDGVRAYNDRLRAAGEAQVLQSQARVNHSVAVDQELDNHKKGVENFWHLRELRRDKVYGNAKTAQERNSQRKRILAAQRPEQDATDWPVALIQGDLAATSQQIDEALRSGQLENALQYIRLQLNQLKSQVGSHPPTVYMASKKFLVGLQYKVTMLMRNGVDPSSLAKAER